MTLSLITAVVITASLLVFLRPIAVSIGLVDRPDARKKHRADVPLIGGISILIGLSLSVLLLPSSLENYRIVFFGIGVLGVIGVLDDRKDVSAKTRIVAQFLVATILVTLDDVFVLHIGDILARDYPVYLGPLSYPLTIIAIVGVINAFNMIDGLDGLAASLLIMACLSVGVLLFLAGDEDHLNLVLVLVAATATFLLFNFDWIVGRSRQVFLGDAGSMVLGFVVVYLLIVASTGGKPPLRVTAAPWIIGLPLLDLLGVLALRILNKTPLFKADRLHIHHVLIDRGLNKITALGALLILQLGFCGIGILGSLNYWPDWALFWAAVMVAVSYIGLRLKFA